VKGGEGAGITMTRVTSESRQQHGRNRDYFPLRTYTQAPTETRSICVRPRRRHAIIIEILTRDESVL